MRDMKPRIFSRYSDSVRPIIAPVIAERARLSGARPAATQVASSCANFSRAVAGVDEVRLNSSENFAAMRMPRGDPSPPVMIHGTGDGFGRKRASLTL